MGLARTGLRHAAAGVRFSAAGRRGIRTAHGRRDAGPAAEAAPRAGQGGRCRHADARPGTLRPRLADVLHAARVAGHQFWDLSQLDAAELDDAARRVLGTALEDVYAAVDLAIGRIVAACPGADLMVISPVGMDVNTSRADMLPEMLAAVLGPSRAASVDGDPARRPPGRSIRRWLRAAVPSGVRKCAGRQRAAGAAGPRSHGPARTPGPRLEVDQGVRTPGRARATTGSTLSSERDGIVTPAEAGPLLDEVASGLRTFRDLDGTPRWPRSSGSPTCSDRARTRLLPDLIVRWTNTPATHVRGIRSDRYGTVMRRGVGAVGPAATPRVTPGCSWCPAGPVRSGPTGLHGLEDIAATAVALSGESTAGMVGQPLLER